MMRTWRAVAWDGRTDHFSAYTESEARQDAVSFCGDSGLKSFNEVT